MANPFAASNPFARAGTGVGLTPAAPADIELPMPAEADSVQCLSWSPTANVVAAGGWDNAVRVEGGGGVHVGERGVAHACGVTSARKASPRQPRDRPVRREPGWQRRRAARCKRPPFHAGCSRCTRSPHTRPCRPRVAGWLLHPAFAPPSAQCVCRGTFILVRVCGDARTRGGGGGLSRTAGPHARRQDAPESEHGTHGTH
jgi:hypothetical protein